MFKPKHTAEVFGGGACKGFYIAGYIKLKEELGITDADLGKKTFKYGVSVGSFLSALMAEGIKYDELDEYFKKNESVIKKIFPIDIFSMFHLQMGNKDENGYNIDTNQQVANSGLAHTNNLEKFLKNFIGAVKFKERPELEFIAVDWDKKCPIYLNYKTCPDSKIIDGCMVSAASPGVYPSRKIKHNNKWKYAIDGGIIENLPIKHALENKNIKDIFAITLSGIFPDEKPPESWWEFLAPSMTLCSSYNEIDFMGKVLEEDYLSFISGNGVKKINYNNKKLNLSILAPRLKPKYNFESNYKNFQELSQIGYEDSKRILSKLMKIQKRRFSFSKFKIKKFYKLFNSII